MDTSIKLPVTERINFRVLIFAGIILFLLGWPVYTFLSETLTHGIHNRGNYKEVDLKALGNFQIDEFSGKLTDIPAEYRALDGQKVQLQGEIYAPYEAGGHLSNFALVYSIQKCCFNGPPKVQERVFASVAAGKKVEYADMQPHEVMGTLHLSMKHAENGQLIEVYHLDVDSVKPLR